MKPSRAFCIVRQQPHYRSDAFLSGLAAAGYQVEQAVPHGKYGAGDVLVTWNRGDQGRVADEFERRGGTVLVSENGYIGADAEGRQHYAIALHGHCGSGVWPAGDGSRWAALGIAVQPFRESGEHILVCCQRGFGSETMRSPLDWPEKVVARLRSLTKRPIRVRRHPGRPACHPEVAADLRRELAGAWACVTWSSASGIRALVEGVPVFYDAPRWIGEGSARKGVEDIETPLVGDAARLSALERMAWAQWNVAEIETGEPFRLLRECLARSAA